MSLALYLSRVRSSDLLGGIRGEKTSVQAQVLDEARFWDHFAWLNPSLVAYDISQLGVNALCVEIRSPATVELRNQVCVHVTDRNDLCGLFIGDFKAEAIFDRQDKLHSIETHSCRLTIELSGGAKRPRALALNGVRRPLQRFVRPVRCAAALRTKLHLRRWSEPLRPEADQRR